MRFLQVLPLALVSFSAMAAAAPQDPSDKPEDPPMLGIHWQRGVTRPVNAAGGAAAQKIEDHVLFRLPFVPRRQRDGDNAGNPNLLGNKLEHALVCAGQDHRPDELVYGVPQLGL